MALDDFSSMAKAGNSVVDADDSAAGDGWLRILT